MTALEKVEALKRERRKLIQSQWEEAERQRLETEKQQRDKLTKHLGDSAFLMEFFKEFWNLNGRGVAVFCVPNHRRVYFEYRQEDPEQQWYFEGDGTESASDLAEALLGAAQ